MSAELPYPSRRPDELGFVNKLVVITSEECMRLIKKEYPVEPGEAEWLCRHFSTKVLKVGAGAVFKPFESKDYDQNNRQNI